MPSLLYDRGGVAAVAALQVLEALMLPLIDLMSDTACFGNRHGFDSCSRHGQRLVVSQYIHMELKVSAIDRSFELCAIARGSWNVGLLTSLAKLLLWNDADLLLDFDGFSQARARCWQHPLLPGVIVQFAKYKDAASLFTWVQVIDVVIGIQSGSQPVCSSSLITDSSVISSLWTAVCLVGWQCAWDNLFLWPQRREQTMSMLAFLTPLGVIAFLTLHVSSILLTAMWSAAR